jgi:hypothetical protein
MMENVTRPAILARSKCEGQCELATVVLCELIIMQSCIVTSSAGMDESGTPILLLVLPVIKSTIQIGFIYFVFSVHFIP